MTLRKINARDIVFQIETATANTWVEVAGLKNVVVNPAENEEVTETTDFDSDGQHQSEMMQRGASLKLEGDMLMDDQTGAQDPGQLRCEVMATKLAVESLGRVRFRHPAQSTWKIWTAHFSLGEQGGGNNDKTGWSCSVVRSGASSSAAVV